MERKRKFTALRAFKSVKARGTEKFRGKGANEVSCNTAKGQTLMPDCRASSLGSATYWFVTLYRLYNLFMLQFPLKMGTNHGRNFLLCELNELIHVKLLQQCLAQKKMLQK